MEQLRKSICLKCDSCAYCRNKESGMLACVNFNKFPKEGKDESLSSRDNK